MRLKQLSSFAAWLDVFIRTPGRAVEFLRYAAISGLSLLLDVASFVVLTENAALGAALAGAVSCMIGLVLHYILSIAFVFDAGATGKSHWRLVMEYGLTGVMGFSITIASIFVVTDLLGAHAMLGKLTGVGLTFVSVYLVRAGIVFAPRAPLAPVRHGGS